MFRFAVGVLVVLAAVVSGQARLRPRRWGWLLLRGIFGGAAVFLYFSCIEHVGAGMATLLNYTAPVWTMLLGWSLLGGRPRRTAAVALALTLLGVVCVVSGSLRSVHNGIWAVAGALSAVASGVASLGLMPVPPVVRTRSAPVARAARRAEAISASGTTLASSTSAPQPRRVSTMSAPPLSG